MWTLRSWNNFNIKLLISGFSKRLVWENIMCSVRHFLQSFLKKHGSSKYSKLNRQIFMAQLKYFCATSSHASHTYFRVITFTLDAVNALANKDNERSGTKMIGKSEWTHKQIFNKYWRSCVESNKVSYPLQHCWCSQDSGCLLHQTCIDPLRERSSMGQICKTVGKIGC